MGNYRIFGSELSPYSVKVRSYFRYKGLPHEWIARSPAVQGEFQKYAKLPLVPLVVTPRKAKACRFDAHHRTLRSCAGRALDRARRSGACFHFRAARRVRRRVGQQVDVSLSLALSARCLVTAERIARQVMEAGGPARRRPDPRRRRRTHDGPSGIRRFQRQDPGHDRGLVQARARTARGSPANAAVYVGRPAGDGRSRPVGQLYEAATDPTPGAIMRASSPRVMTWVERMVSPKAEGAFEPWAALAPTVMPLLKEEVAAFFLPWSTANAAAIAREDKSFEMTLAGAPWSRCRRSTTRVRWLKSGASLPRPNLRPGLESILGESGCLPYLSS